MVARKLTIIGTVVTVLAMMLVISSQLGNTYENTPRIFGVDSLLLGAVLILSASTIIIIYAIMRNI